MPRIKRLVIPEVPHHVVNRGNRNQQVFWRHSDYVRYLDLLTEFSSLYGVKIVCYCLMTNHVHLIAIPPSEMALAQTIGDTHRAYTRMINFREGWRGMLWQGRFFSCPMDERYSLQAARYVLLNPVKANLVSTWQEYPYSSAHQHLNFSPQALIQENYFGLGSDEWLAYVGDGNNQKVIEEDNRMAMHTRTGRPLGSSEFVKKVEMVTGRSLVAKKPGPKTHL